MAGAAIGALRVVLGLNTAEFEAGSRRAQAEAQSMGRGVSGAMRRMQVESEAAFEGMRRGAELLGLALGAEQLVEFAKGTLEWAGSLGEAAMRIGVTVEQLQALRRQAAASETSTEGMERAIAFFNRTLGQAQAGVPRAVQIFRALGFTPAQIHGFHDGIDALGQTYDKLNSLRTPAEAAAAGARLFGRGYAEIIPMVREGSEGLDHWNQVARDSGEINAEQAREAHQATEALGQLAITIRTDLASALVDILPFLRSVAGDLQELGGMAQWAFTQIRSLSGGQSPVSTALDGVMNVLNPLHAIRNIAGTAGGLYNRFFGDAPGGRTGTAVGHYRPPAAGNDLDLSPAGHQRHSSDAAEKRALRDQHQFDSDLRRQQIEQLQEQKQRTNDFVEQNHIQDQIVTLNRDQYKSDLDLRVATHDLTTEKENQLLQAYDQSDIQRRLTIAASEHADRVRETATMDENDYNLARGRLQQEEAAAQTAEERRRIELQLLDLDYQFRRLKLQNIVRETNVYDLATRLDAQHQLDGLGASQAADRAGVLRNTRGPLADYLAGLPDTAAKAREALQGVAVQGLQGITDGLAAAITGTQKWGDVFKNVATQILADLIKIQLEQRVVGLIGNAISGLIGGGGPSPVFADNIPSLGDLPARAAGGPVLPGGTYLVGEKGPELLRMGGGGGTIVPHDQVGGGGNVIVNQTFAPNFAGNAATRGEMLQLASMVKPMAIEAFKDFAGRR